MRIDFQDLKARIPIEMVAQVLQPDMKETNGEVRQFRAPCPQCRVGGERAIAVTPGKGYFCNADKRGGDVIAYASHIQGIPMRQAAEWLVARFNLTSPAQAPAPSPTPPAPPPVTDQVEGLQPLKNLDASHEAVKALKLAQEVAEALGAGHCTKGLMKGLVAFPLRLPTGKLVGYIGVKDGKLPTSFKL